MKKISVMLAVLLVMMSVLPIVPAYAAEAQQLPFELQSQAIYMENLETGRVMVEKNADKPFAPASLTKIMTAVLTLENVEDLDGESHYLRVAVNEMIVGRGAKTGGLYPGDSLTIRDLLYESLVYSAAECALMLADYVSDGSISHFVDMMNERAAELGCTGTKFTDPHGLDEEQYTTARDMAIIAKYAMSLPGFAEIVATPVHQISALNRDYSFPIVTTNSMLRSTSEYYYAPVFGIKTGTITNERTLATIAKKDGYTYLAVQLGVPIADAQGQPTKPTILSFDEAQQMYEWVFESFQIRTAVERGEELVEIPVKYSVMGDFVRLATGEQFTALLHKDISASSILYEPDIPEYLIAPVEKGTQVGTLRLIYMEEEIGSVPLITTADLPRSDLLALWGMISNEIHTFRAKFIIVFVLLIVALYIWLFLRYNRSRRRQGKYSSYRTSEKNYRL